MRIHDIDTIQTADRVRARATVTWENALRPAAEVFIETAREQAEGFAARPGAFLTGCLIPAMHLGEKRIAVEGKVCPVLLENLSPVMALMRNWSGGAMQPLSLEPEGLATAAAPDRISMNTPRTGMVYSGGIDSIATLRSNMLRYPADHPGRIRECFFIHGFDIGGVVARGMKYPVFERGLLAMKTVTEAADTIPVPVYTNIRHLCDERDLWLNHFFGAVLAAVGHAFSGRIDRFVIASSYDLDNLVPCGSHPMLDPWYSGLDLLVEHKDVHLRRIDKLKITSEWEPAFQNLRVCLANVKDRLNCGACEKCVRTMTGLVAIGALHRTRAFVEDDVRPEMFSGFRITIRHREPFYEELLPFLEERGRLDLADAIRQKLAE